MSEAPALYVGTVRHRRFTPRAHAFEYSLFMSLLDIDAIEASMQVSWLTGCNRWNLASFDDRDHLDGAGPLRERLRANALAHGRDLPAGRILLLTHLRYAGYVFNPISLYYCFDARNVLQCVLADVRNTYGGRRSYWLAPADEARHRFRAVRAKSLYVSPFMDGDVDYEFLLTPPAASLTTHMNVTRRASGARVFDATLRLERRPWTALSIRRTLAAYPLMTAKVIAAIYFEALRLRWKGVPEVPALTGRL